MSIKQILLIPFLLCALQSSFAEPAKILDSDVAIQNAILKYINAYRTQHGLSALEMDNRIVIEAKNHSLDMARHRIPFGHLYFSDRIRRLRSQISNVSAGAENVAYNYKDAQDVVKNWLLSRGHKANIDGHYNLTGIGIARDGRGKIYFTQIFLLRQTKKQYALRRPARTSIQLPFFINIT